MADRERASGVEPLELDPLQPDRDDVEGAVGVGLDLGQLDPAADPEQRLRAVVADLVALADADRAEDPLARVLDAQQVVDQGAVAVLEDASAARSRPGTAPRSAGTSAGRRSRRRP